MAPEATQRMGPAPLIIECDDPHREFTAVRERLLDLVSDGRFRVSDFAVLAPRVELAEQARNVLVAGGLPCAPYRDEAFDVLEEQVKVLTIHSAKGLEFPVVFVLGVREGLLPQRPGARLESEERELEVERQRTLLYVAMTRAAEALFLVTVTGARSGFLHKLGDLVHSEPFR